MLGQIKMKILLLFNFLLSTCQAIPRVSAPSGTFIGNDSISQLDQFLGIRYAQPPLHQLRFSNPVAYPSSSGKLFNATDYGPGCTQIRYYLQYNGLSEDCLTLNVIRPSGTASNASLPVLFWIHGGGNMNGQSEFYNGTALVQHSITAGNPIVYVSINYRLGGFGFLRSVEAKEAGVLNLGLKDQYLALQWASENIASFGGDPTKITIFGESAGAANCWSQLHYAEVQNEANKYFRGMITESGAPGSPAFPLALPASDQTALPYVTYSNLLAKTNCTGRGLPCLREVPHDVIAPLLINAFVIDYTLDDDWFSDDLTSLVEAGQFAALPIIHGTNLDEGTFFMPSVFQYPNETALIKTIASYIGNNTRTALELWKAYNKLPDAALGKGPKGDPTAVHSFWVATAIYTDLWMQLGRTTLLNIASQKADTWGYDFRQEPPLTSLNLSYEYPGASKTAAERYAVYHGSELPYVFGEATSLAGHTQGDDTVAIAMMDAWISFAYYLDPNKGRADNVPFWPTYDSSSVGELMTFQDQSGYSIRVTQDNLRASVYKLWSDALSAIGQNPPF